MPITIQPSIQTRARAIAAADPALTLQQIARQLGCRTSDMRHALEARQAIKRKSIAPTRATR